MAGVVFAFAILVVLAFLIALGRRARDRREAAAATTQLTVDAWGVKRWLADGRYEEIAWDQLDEVRTVTLPKGPWPVRTRIVLDGGGVRGCVVALDVADEFGLVEALAALPGLDHRRLAEVLEEERTGEQVIWRRTST